VIRIGLVGLGKMGLSHLSILGAHPDVQVAAVTDAAGYVLSVLSKYTGFQTYSDFDAMLDGAELDAVLIATPTRLHAPMVRKAMERGLHVFCEKPLTLTSDDSSGLAELAAEKGLVTQVGYHNRFVAAFQEVRTLLDAGAIGRVTHALAEAYGPVVLRPTGGTWRSKRDEGGGCLYDYAAHPIDLVRWYLGEPSGCGGSVLGKVFSRETEDEVFSTLYFPGGASAQLSVNWSDESCRKMTTSVTLWGTKGRIQANRQEIQVYLREGADLPAGYTQGWNIRYTTELTTPVSFYLRGEEYSAQIDHFLSRIRGRDVLGTNSFDSGAKTDRILDMIKSDADGGPVVSTSAAPPRVSATTGSAVGARVRARLAAWYAGGRGAWRRLTAGRAAT
jgi:predicted dehydrogenase